MLRMLGSLHANRDKIIKHIKGLYWSNKVENIRHKFESEGKVQCVRAQAKMWKFPASSDVVLRQLIRSPKK